MALPFVPPPMYRRVPAERPVNLPAFLEYLYPDRFEKRCRACYPNDGYIPIGRCVSVQCPTCAGRGWVPVEGRLVVDEQGNVTEIKETRE